jgi:hypothetical protein
MNIRPIELIADPLYQVNLIIWMLQPSTGTPVNCILHDAGYTLRDIEPKLPLPLELANKLKEDRIPCTNPVSPEVVVESRAKEFVPIECKRTMFGSQPQEGQGDSQIRQARSLLLQTPPVLADALGLQHTDIRSTHILYLSRDEPSKLQTAGVSELASELRSSGYRTAPFGLLGLRISGNAVVVVGGYEPGTLPSAIASRISTSGVQAHDLGDGSTDPRPLYLIPWMPGGVSESDDYSEAAFGNRMLSAAVAVIGPCRPPCDVRLDIEDLLREATQGLYTKWRDKLVRRALKNNSKKLLKRHIERYAPGVVLQALGSPDSGWQFSITDQDTHSKIIEGLRKWMDEEWNRPAEPGLFDQLEDAE